MKAEGQDVVGFGAGEPDFHTPDYIKEAGIEAIRNNDTKYTPSVGTVEVRKAGGDKCERCWMYSEELGTDPAYPTVCPRCAAVLRELAAREEGAR